MSDVIRGNSRHMYLISPSGSHQFRYRLSPALAAWWKALVRHYRREGRPLSATEGKRVREEEHGG